MHKTNQPTNQPTNQTIKIIIQLQIRLKIALFFKCIALMKILQWCAVFAGFWLLICKFSEYFSYILIDNN